MKHFFVIILSVILFQAKGQTIPDSLRVDWSHAGLEGTYNDSLVVLDITTFGAIANDSLDDHSAIVSAINSLGGNAGVIYFPPGTYVIGSTINLPDSIILRGAGSDSTILQFSFAGASANSINISGTVTNSWHSISSGYTKGSHLLIVPGADSLFSLNDEIEIHEVNGSWDTNPASWADFSVGHLSAIEYISVDTLYLMEPFRMDLDSALMPEIRKIVPRTHCGLECFKMIRTDDAAGINFAVNFTYAKNCWMKGIESELSICAHVSLETSSHINISGCYFHEAYLYDGASTHGYGVVVYAHSCSNKIENNIFRMLRHAMIAKQGANGNVFGYNYSRETNRSEPIADYAADICLHGHYAYANLFEGNIVQNLQVDQAWGPSGPFNTFFRNKIENYGIIMSSGTVESDRQNFVGNDLSNSAFLHGMYTLAGTAHFESGNNVRGTITPNGTGNLSDTSYYLTTVPPSYWDIPAQPPSVGIPNTFTDDVNPSLHRYLAGGVLTVCGDEQDTSVTTHVLTMDNLADVSCYVLDKQFIIQAYSGVQQQAIVKLYSVTGQEIFTQPISLQSGWNEKRFSLPELSEGIYLFRLQNKVMEFSEKILVK